MSKGYIVVCPATRGIGLSFARHLLRHTTLPIVLTHRKLPPPSNLTSSPRISTLQLDVTDESTIASASAQLTKKFPEEEWKCRLFISCAGVLHPERNIGRIDVEEVKESFLVNVVGGMLLMKHFGHLLGAGDAGGSNGGEEEERGGKEVEGAGGGEGGGTMPKMPLWACLSARLGSTSDNRTGGWYSYRASKAALNSVVKTFDIHLKTNHNTNNGAMCVGLHPGTVKTDLTREFWGSVEGKGGRLFEVDESVGRLWGVMCGLERGQGGRCWDWRGEEVLP